MFPACAIYIGGSLLVIQKKVCYRLSLDLLITKCAEVEMKKICLITLSLVLSSTLIACDSSPESHSSTNANTSATIAATPTPATSSAEPTVVNTESKELADGSTVLTKTYSDGSKTEERSFKSGPVTTVRRRTTSSGVTAHVTHRENGEEVEIKDSSWIDKAMDATGDALATAASKTKSGVETAIDKTKEGAQKTGSVVKEGAQKTGSAVKEGAKDVGKGLKKVGEKVKDKVKN